MPRAKSQMLFVNLSASKVRQRLKTSCIGVRKVSSAGRNQAMIVHTATGQHLRDLESVFTDAPTSSSQSSLGMPIENLKNLGPTTASWLHELGIHTRADLERLGPAPAYRLLRQRESTVSLNLLWALHGALDDTDWRELTPQMKRDLQRQVEELR